MPEVKEIDIEKIRRRDESALRDFFDHLVPRLYLYASRVSVDPVDADELVNATVFRIFKNIDSVANMEAPYAYCMRVMKNVLADHIRHASTMKRVSLDAVTDREDTDEILQFHIPPVDTPSDFESVAEASATLELLLAKLSEDEQRLIKMHIIDEMSFEEMANVLEKGVPETRYLYNKIRAKLRYRLKSLIRKTPTL